MGIAKLALVLVGGLVAILMLLLHPAGPGVVLLAISPFDGLWTAFFGVMGNGVTFIPIGAVLLRNNPGAWLHLLTGSRIQMTMLIFVLLILVSHLYVVPERPLGTAISYGRKVTLFLIVGVLVWTWRKSEYLELSVKAFVLSTAAYALINMADFYLGIQILPYAPGDVIEGAAGLEYEEQHAGRFRLRVVGLPINRWASWMLLPIMLSVGWLASKASLRGRLLAAGSLVTLVVCELATISRSGLGAMAVGFLTIAAMAFKLKPTNILLIVLTAAVLGTGIYSTIQVMELDKVFESRLDEKNLDRGAQGRWHRTKVGFIVFAESPLIGVGDGMFQRYSDPLIDGAADAHNGYTHVLAELGLLGFLPFMLILFLTISRLSFPAPNAPPSYEHYRPYFLGGFVATLVHMLAHSLEWERTLWVAVAFAATLERVSVWSQATARPTREPTPLWNEDPLKAGTRLPGV